MKTILILTALVLPAQVGWAEEPHAFSSMTVTGWHCVESSTSSYWEDEEDEPAFSSMTITGWHCVETVSVSTSCAAEWTDYRERIKGLTHCEPGGLCSTFAVYIIPPNCRDEQKCSVEQGYRSDGTVVWREP